MPYRYLWHPYLFRGNLNLLAGDGGTGKSYLSLAIAAAVTTGVQPEGMPGQMTGEPGSVLLCSTEDDAPQIRDRFDRLGGDADRLFMPPPGVYADLNKVEDLRNMVRECSARLVIFDPVQSFLVGADMNRASDVRPLLDGLRGICRQENCTALLLAHSNKAEKMGKAQYRVAGTGDFVNGCRSALLVGFHPQEAGVRVAAHMKSNGEYGQSFRFTVDGEGFRWAGEDSSTPEEIMNAPRIKRAAKQSDSANPIVLLIVREVQKRGGAWSATSAQMVEASRSYPDLLPLHTPQQITIGEITRNNLKKKYGITATRPNRNHPWYFCRT